MANFRLSLVACLAFLVLWIGSASVEANEVQDSNFIVVSTNPKDKQAMYHYDANGRIIFVIGPNNSVVSYLYDANGNMYNKQIKQLGDNQIFSSSSVSYEIYVYGLADTVKKVNFPTWTASNGQDDLEVIQGTKMGSGVWKATVVYSKHGSQVGDYITEIHADGQKVQQVQVEVKSTTSIRAPKEVSLKEGKYDVYIDGVASSVAEVSFPTWTANNGQDDLEIPYIKGVKVSEGTWKLTIPFDKHNNEAGDYITHYYTYDAHGNSQGIGGTVTKVLGGVEAPQEVELSAVSHDIMMYGLAESVKKVEFPTWTAASGQDDLEVIQGTKVAKGIWKATVVYSKHGSQVGDYITEIIADGQKVQQVQVKVKSATTTRAPKEVSLKEGKYDVFVDGVASSVAEVRFPTWTANNGQDDLEFPYIKGVKVSEGTWKITIPFDKHNNEIGDYNTHIYSYDQYGNSRMISGIVTKVLGGVDAPQEIDLSAVSHDIMIYGLADSVKKVEFPTWTLSNGQDDLEVIQGTKVAKGIWKATVVYSKHGSQVGDYITEIIADGQKVQQVQTKVKSTASMRAPKEVSLKEGKYDVFIDGVASTVAEVRFPTWTANNGQDDLEIPYIKGVKVSEGTWKITIPFDKHNNETGDYITHYYTYDAYGNSLGIGGTVTKVLGGVEAPQEIDISAVSHDIMMYGLPESVKKVEFPTWTLSNGQDDLEMIQGTKVAKGVWKATVVYSKHGSQVGDYITEVIADGQKVQQVQVKVKSATTIRAPKEVSLKEGKYDVFIDGVASTVAEVRFPTWTANNGQDDLEIPYIKGVKVSEGTWKITIPFNKHNNETGDYITHYYTYDASGNSMGIGGSVTRVVD